MMSFFNVDVSSRSLRAASSLASRSRWALLLLSLSACGGAELAGDGGGDAGGGGGAGEGGSASVQSSSSGVSSGETPSVSAGSTGSASSTASTGSAGSGGSTGDGGAGGGDDVLPDTFLGRDPSPEARNLLRYIYSLHGNKMLSGQMESTWTSGGADYEINYIRDKTGKLPAIRGLDYIDYNGTTDRAIAWWNNGGIPTIMWHWGAPTKGQGYEASKMTIDIGQALTPGTEVNRVMMADLDRTARELTRLKEAHVPVIWRPFHELDGGWFWWSKEGPDQFKKLWTLMFDYYTDTYHLDNLIWVLGFDGEPDGAWYPGDEYVDIAGADTYGGMDSKKAMYEDVASIVGDEMPICYHECDPIPDPDAVVRDGVDWVWFMAWHTDLLVDENPVSHLQKVYSHEHVITHDELPDLRN
ncbi:glycosyl hydrolase [Sorangium sp. So ce388]|uniref:glycosyl hydrolase n=1 Tax=Sorangium sp. So ce388 TaxID=3133309 RepID=UPI003F5B6124